MGKGVIVASGWDEKERIAYVQKQTKYGTYFAEVIADEEDFDISTEWDGYRFASYKCDLQYMNEKAKRLYERYMGVRTAYNNLTQMLTPEECEADPVLVKLQRQVAIAKRDAANARKLYKRMSEYYIPFTEDIIAERKRLQEWKTKRGID